VVSCSESHGIYNPSRSDAGSVRGYTTTGSPRCRSAVSRQPPPYRGADRSDPLTAIEIVIIRDGSKLPLVAVLELLLITCCS
jgi:hypothetical protein